MATNFHLPAQQIVDANGNPYAGAKAYFYVTGTTTPLNVYSDSTLITPLSNPVVADSSGRWVPIFMSPAIYRVDIKTSADVLITSSNGYDPAQAIGSGALPITLGGTGATTAAQARINLGLGTASVLNTGTSSGQIPLLDGVGLPAVSGVQLTAIPAVTQAEQEAGTNNVKAVTPLVQQYHPSASKCWAYVTVSAGVPTLTAGAYNITSITDTGVGQLTVTINVDFSSVNWVASLVCEAAVNRFSIIVSKTAGTVLLGCQTAVPAFADPDAWNFIGMGDQ